jgi:hypothetical protein
MELKASVAMSFCFPTYEFKPTFAENRTTMLKVHNKTPTLNIIHSISIPTPTHTPEPRFIELPEDPVMPCSLTASSTPAVERSVEEQ